MKTKLVVLRPRRIEAVLRFVNTRGRKTVVARLARPDHKPRPAA